MPWGSLAYSIWSPDLDEAETAKAKPLEPEPGNAGGGKRRIVYTTNVSIRNVSAACPPTHDSAVFLLEVT